MTNSVPVFADPSIAMDVRARNQTIRLAPPLYGDQGVVTLRIGTGFYADQQNQSLELNLGEGLDFEAGSPYKLVVKHDGTLKAGKDGTLTVTVTSDRVFDAKGQVTVAQQVSAIHAREASLEAHGVVQERLLDLRRRRSRLARSESRTASMRERGLASRGV